jgi:hypothetical protein
MFRELPEAPRTCAQQGNTGSPCRKAIHFHILWPLFLLLLAVSAPLRAQTPVLRSALPNAPVAVDSGASMPQGSGVITGTLENPQGLPLPNAPLRVFGRSLPHPIAGKTNAQGVFRIDGLPAGNFHVQASAKDYLTATSPMVVLGQGEVYHLNITEIPLPKAITTVKVYASTVAIATAQVHQEEKQRVLGIVPDFFTSYQPNPAPLTAKLKMKLTLRTIRDPFIFGVAAAVAGMEQQQNIYPGYGSGWSGYGKRFGAAYADSNISRIFGEGIYPALFHQDPRYFYKGTGSFMSRLWYAMRSAVVAKGDNGHWQPAYANILGDFTAAGISNAYHSPQDRGLSITMRDSGILLAGDAFESVLREFLSKSLTSNLPPGVKH